MKLPCSECQKKISIDDAFAGMVCRCPYCRALVFVPGGDSQEVLGGRPAAPGEPARPTTPDDLKAMADSQGAKVPVADPVKVQGIVTLVLLGVLVLMIGGTVAYFTIDWSGSGDGNGNGKEDGAGTGQVGGFNDGPQANPSLRAEGVTGPWVLGNIPIQTPVVFVLDGGDSMKDHFDTAKQLTRWSISDFGSGDEFNVVICRDNSLEAEGKPELLLVKEGWKTGPDQQAVENFCKDYQGRGMSDVVKGLEAAVAMKPGTIVLFTAKVLGEKLQPAIEVMKKAKKDGVYLVTVALQDFPSVKKDMRELAKAVEGATRVYLQDDFMSGRWKLKDLN